MNADQLMNYEQAVELIKKAVKPSHLANQPHIDLTLVPADQRETLQKAIMSVKAAVIKGEKSEEEVKLSLGLVP